MQFFIEKIEKAYIISKVLGASSNGRTRDFGSLYHGSNPCAPTKNSTGIFAGLIFGRARIRQSEAHGEYADEQLATAQKRIFLIEFLHGVGYCLSRSRAHSREQKHKTLASSKVKFRFFIFLNTLSNRL